MFKRRRMIEVFMSKELPTPGAIRSGPGKPNPRRDALVEGKHQALHLKPGSEMAALVDQEASVIARAVEVIGDRGEALRWMGTPVRALDYATPISLVATVKGRQAVVTVLGRLEHGVL